MLPFTLDTHFTYGYGQDAFRGDKTGPLWCLYSRCSREPSAFPDECRNVAAQLAQAAKELDRKIFVMLSGGLDSEVVVKAFLAAGVEFEAITYRFTGGLNDHEVKFVDAFIARHQIRHRYFDIDIAKWAYSDECKDLMLGSGAASLALAPHMKLMNHIWFELGGLPVLGNGDMYFEKLGGKWNYVELEYMLSWYRHAVRFGILGGIGFFQYTPEITLSMLRHPKFERLGKNEDKMANKLYDTSKYIKYSIYRSYWPDLVMRPKFDGQEMVQTLFRKAEKPALAEMSETFQDKFVLPYEEFRAMLEPT